MKSRIIEMLVGFSSEEVPKAAQGMLELLATETSLSEEKIKERASEIVKHILHHYAQFSVETIDNFNHRLIRTFARDLKLSANFEVTTDIDLLISKAVDQVIDQAGRDPDITKVLIEFALQKTDEDKSWDISFDLKQAAGLLKNENEARYLTLFQNKSLEDFMVFRKKLAAETKALDQQIKDEALAVLSLLESNDIPQEVFMRKTLPNHFLKLTEGSFDVYGNKLEENLEAGGRALYTAKTPEEVAAQIDAITPTLLEAYLDIKSKVYRFKLVKNLLKNLVPLATVNLVSQELQRIKEEDNVLPISDFNAIIHNQIKDEPAPFIYERLGDRYRDFFIDEFQDTSFLQWQNLMPLAENTLSQAVQGEHSGSLFIVGDVKQSIYRWRGGLPEQFMSLYEGDNPFHTALPPDIKTLDTNYRSTEVIIDFNNSFFSYISNHFGDQRHRKLYEFGNRQKHNSRKGGFVQLEFVEAESAETKMEVYPERVLEKIHSITAQGFLRNDICILTRKKKEGIAISEFLLQHGISVISPETLLLENSETVRALVHIIRLSSFPNDDETKIKLLHFLHSHLGILEEKDTFFQALIHQPLAVLSERLKERSIHFSFEDLQHLSLFECCEYCIHALTLHEQSDAFLTSFMDMVFRYAQQPEANKTAFLEYWELEKERVSISETKSADAVYVMTIHKAKGLEFPVVIFPFANLDLYQEINPIAWYPWQEDGFDYFLIDYKKELAEVGAIGSTMVEERRNMLELDNLNLLYVTFTRAEQQLYILADTPKESKEPTTYNVFLQNFLAEQNLWNSAQTLYEFGSQTMMPIERPANKVQSVHAPYIVSPPENHDVRLITSEGEEVSQESMSAMYVGNLLHDTMAQIVTSEDMNRALEDLEKQLKDAPELYEQVAHMIQGIVNHEALKHLFADNDAVHIERDIISPEQILRPDRVNVHTNQQVTLVDYKTGGPKEGYEFQINSYAMALQDMGFTVKEKLLVYCNHDSISINKT